MRILLALSLVGIFSLNSMEDREGLLQEKQEFNVINSSVVKSNDDERSDVNKLYEVIQQKVTDNNWEAVFDIVSKMPKELKVQLQEKLVINNIGRHTREILIPSQIVAIASYPPNQWLVTYLHEGKLFSIDLMEKNKLLKEIVLEGADRIDHTSASLLVSLPAKQVALVQKDAIYLYNIENGNLKKIIEAKDDNYIISMCYSHDGSLLAVSYVNGVTVFKNGTYEILRQFGSTKSEGIALSSNNKLVAFQNKETLEIWNITDQTCRTPCLTSKTLDLVVKKLLFSSNNNYLTYNLDNQVTGIIDLIKISSLHRYYGCCLGLSQDSKFCTFSREFFNQTSPKMQGIYRINIEEGDRKKFATTAYKTIQLLGFSPDAEKLACIGKLHSDEDSNRLSIVNLDYSCEEYENKSLEALIVLWYYEDQQEKSDLDKYEGFIKAFERVPCNYLQASKEIPFLYYKSIAVTGSPRFPYPFPTVRYAQKEITFLEEKRSNQAEKEQKRPYKRRKIDSEEQLFLAHK